MGNSVFGDGSTAPVIHKFYSPSSWIDGNAEAQLELVAALKGVSKISAFPDLHPGKNGPVGCAILADRIYPELIGNDIGCGMALFALDQPAHKLKLDKAAKKWSQLENFEPKDHFGFSTIGGGNHFCELQKVDESKVSILSKGQLCILVHTGSRAYGNGVLSAWHDDLISKMHPDKNREQLYLHNHERALHFARDSRLSIAEQAAKLLGSQAQLIADSPHNIIEYTDRGWLHRKGAARADALVPLAGSRSSHSFLMRPLRHRDALDSLAHGAGRKFNRSQMRERIKSRSNLLAQERNRFGGHVICDDRIALAEEAGEAYKSISKVVSDLKQFQIAQPIAKFTPLITFKNAKQGD